MRLLQAMASDKEGGAELFFERLAAGLQRANVTQRLVVRKDSARNQRLRAAGLDIAELPFGGFFDWRTKFAFRKQISEFKPTVVLSWMNRATGACPRGDFVHAARLGGYYNLKYYRHCHHLIGNTRGIVSYLEQEGWPPERVHYLPNFVAVEKAAPVSRESLQTPADAPLALALGRLHPNKGFDILIAAMEKLPRFHLWLAGEGGERAELEAQAKRQGVSERVHFLGWRQDVPALLAAADMFVCSSRHEPLGNVVIEAWAAGKPVVAAASPGPAELIRDGQTGLLVPGEDADALAAAMAKMFESRALRDQLAMAGHAAYEAEFSESRVIGLYCEFFETVKR
jgi:glycosyltransferase involved in cell wall biosynthesis